MKAVILAGGFGTRISEESSVRPKPMVEIGRMPILWHIMKTYSQHGISEFIVCCGYKGEVIKQWFANYHLRDADVTFDLGKNEVNVHSASAEPWKVTLAETGSDSMTGGRIKRVSEYIDGEPFCMTYGDGVGDVNIRKSIEFHKSHGKLATMTAFQPDQRFGVFSLEGDQTQVSSFAEKPKGDSVWANAGYFVLQPEVLDYIEGDNTVWEVGPMQRLAQEGQLVANRHTGFWMPMDTLRDKNVLEDLWSRDAAPWKCW